MTKDKNIINVCKCCTESRTEAFQSKWNEVAILFNSGQPIFIKAGFDTHIDSCEQEHMWIKVSHIDFENKKVYGTLNNDPVVAKQYYCDMPVEMDFSVCSDLYLDKETFLLHPERH